MEIRGPGWGWFVCSRSKIEWQGRAAMTAVSGGYGEVTCV